MTVGSVYFTQKTGKVLGPFSGTLENATPKDGDYLDVKKGGKGYPSKIDFTKDFDGKVVMIEFKPGVGKASKYTSWRYLNHKDWAVDRFMDLG
ncbi:MAG: hypothetical protein QNJ16_12195 [Rhodobacter sp.]|nr:hypothetical protein [Rhodobacter sp.]